MCVFLINSLHDPDAFVQVYMENEQNELKKWPDWAMTPVALASFPTAMIVQASLGIRRVLRSSKIADIAPFKRKAKSDMQPVILRLQMVMLNL